MSEQRHCRCRDFLNRDQRYMADEPCPGVEPAALPALPWPVADILSRLADAAEHLLRDHDCDRHGYEEVGTCVARAREEAAKPPAYVPSDLDALLIEQFADKVVKEHPWWVVTELRALAARMRGKT